MDKSWNTTGDRRKMGLFDKGSGFLGKSSGGMLGRSTIMSDGNGFSNGGRPIYI